MIRKLNICLRWRHRNHDFWILTSVTRLGNVLDFLVKKCLTKVAQNIVVPFRAILNHTTFMQKWLAHFFGTIGKHWVTFYSIIWSHWSWQLNLIKNKKFTIVTKVTTSSSFSDSQNSRRWWWLYLGNVASLRLVWEVKMSFGRMSFDVMTRLSKFKILKF